MLEHTLHLSSAQWRVLDQCHRARNLAEYEGHLDVNAQLLKELVEMMQEIETRVKALAPL